MLSFGINLVRKIKFILFSLLFFFLLIFCIEKPKKSWWRVLPTSWSITWWEGKSAEIELDSHVLSNHLVSKLHKVSLTPIWSFELIFPLFILLKVNDMDFCFIFLMLKKVFLNSSKLFLDILLEVRTQFLSVPYYSNWKDNLIKLGKAHCHCKLLK